MLFLGFLFFSRCLPFRRYFFLLSPSFCQVFFLFCPFFPSLLVLSFSLPGFSFPWLCVSSFFLSCFSSSFLSFCLPVFWYISCSFCLFHCCPLFCGHIPEKTQDGFGNAKNLTGAPLCNDFTPRPHPEDEGCKRLREPNKCDWCMKPSLRTLCCTQLRTSICILTASTKPVIIILLSGGPRIR